MTLPVAAAAAAALATLVAVQPYHSFMLTAGYVVIPVAALLVIVHVVGPVPEGPIPEGPVPEGPVPEGGAPGRR